MRKSPLILPPTSESSDHHTVTNITMSLTSLSFILPALHCKIKIIFFKFILLCMFKWSRNSSFSIFWSRDWFNINLRKPLKVNNGIQFPYDFFYFDLANQILRNSDSEHHHITRKKLNLCGFESRVCRSWQLNIQNQKDCLCQMTFWKTGRIELGKSSQYNILTVLCQKFVPTLFISYD